MTNQALAPHKLTTDQRINLTRLCGALESGKYKQQTGGLHNHVADTFCCLGVACNISNLGDWKHELGHRSTYMLDKSKQKCSGWLESVAVRNLYGFNHDRGWTALQLADLNDDHVSFTNIAKSIRHYMEKH